MQWVRVRFLIWLTVLGALCAAVLLVFRVFIDPYSSWRHISFRAVIAVALTLMSLVLALAVVFGQRSARFFALGFVLGAAVENRALVYYAAHDLLRSTPGTWVPEGWYPLTVPLERALVERGWGSIAAPPLSAAFAGMALSGILCGLLLLIVSQQVRRVTKSERTERPAV